MYQQRLSLVCRCISEQLGQLRQRHTLTMSTSELGVNQNGRPDWCENADLADVTGHV